MKYVYWGGISKGKREVRQSFLFNRKTICRISNKYSVEIRYIEDGSQVIKTITSQDNRSVHVHTKRSEFDLNNLYHYEFNVGNKYFGTLRERKKDDYIFKHLLLPFTKDVAEIVNQYDPDCYIFSEDWMLPYLDLKVAKHFLPYKSSCDSFVKLLINTSLEADPEKISVGDYSGLFSYLYKMDRQHKKFTQTLIDGGYDWEWFNLDNFDEYKKFGLEQNIYKCVNTLVETTFEKYKGDRRFSFLVDACQRYVEEYKDKLSKVYPLMT